jgi:hypothetical protein
MKAQKVRIFPQDLFEASLTFLKRTKDACLYHISLEGLFQNSKRKKSRLQLIQQA